MANNLMCWPKQKVITWSDTSPQIEELWADIAATNRYHRVDIIVKMDKGGDQNTRVDSVKNSTYQHYGDHGGATG